MNELEAGGDSVEEAVDRGLQELGVTEDQVEVEVLEEAPEARVRLRVRTDGQAPAAPGDTPETRPEDDRELLEFAREDALDFLEGLLDSMGLEGRLEIGEAEGMIHAELWGEDLGLLIGRYGRTLDSLQELLRAAVQHQAAARVRVTLDIEGYRDRRRQAIAELTQEMAERARSEGEVRMEPMPAYERKVVHDTVSEIEGLSSASEGEEPYRYVIIRSD
jgi:spoIIIJ-associated protein